MQPKTVRAPVAFDTWGDQGQRRQLRLDDGGLLLKLQALKGNRHCHRRNFKTI